MNFYSRTLLSGAGMIRKNEMKTVTWILNGAAKSSATTIICQDLTSMCGRNRAFEAQRLFWLPPAPFGERA